MTDTTKNLLSRLNAVDVVGKTLPAFVTEFDADCQWLNGDEVCTRRRWGIVQGCRYLLVLIGATKNETVEMCFAERADANAVAKLSIGWGAEHAQVYWINQSLRQNAFCPSRWEPEYGSLSYCDGYDFARGEEEHGATDFDPNAIKGLRSYFPQDFDPLTVIGHLPR